MFKLVKVYTVEKLNGAYPSCDHCGHDIRNIFVIEDKSGKQMKVGSDCVIQLTARTQAHTDSVRWQARIERAAAQWRDAKKKLHYPQPLSGETREQYINRRINEMSRALDAGKAWSMHYSQKFQSKGHIGGWSWTWDMKVEQRAARMGVKIERTQIIRRHLERYAKKFNANIFDMQRPIWELVKV